MSELSITHDLPKLPAKFKKMRYKNDSQPIPRYRQRRCARNKKK